MMPAAIVISGSGAASVMEEVLTKAATGLAIIIPAIFLIRWILNKRVGSPEEWVEYHVKELQQRYAKGEIDEETYQKRLKDLTEE